MNKILKDKLRFFYYECKSQYNLIKPIEYKNKNGKNILIIASSSPSHLISLLKLLNNLDDKINIKIIAKLNHIEIAKISYPDYEYIHYEYDGSFKPNIILKYIDNYNIEYNSSLIFLSNNKYATGYKNIFELCLMMNNNCYYLNSKFQFHYLSINQIKDRLNIISIENSLTQWYKNDYIP